MQDTATKAHAAGIGTSAAMLLLFFVGPHIGLAIPPVETVTEAFTNVATSLIVGGIGWITTYVSPANRPK